MPNLIDIRRRIRSVKNTQQITKAMKMVAAARMRRAQDRVIASRPYARELAKVIANIAAKAGEKARHALLAERPVKKAVLAIVTGDKGLCGSFNATVLRESGAQIKSLTAAHEVELLLLGKKGADLYKRRSTPIREAHTALFSRVTYEQADAIAQDLARAFEAGEIDSVVVVYNAFRSIIQQELRVEQLLPVKPTADAGGGDGSGVDYLYEPSAEKILAELLPRYLSFRLYSILLESAAAEHAARMTAMDSATKNAKDLIERLSMTYNRARQAAITKELIEVVSGANALEG